MQGARFTRLVTDLVDIMRLEHGRLALRREAIDLAALACDVLEAFEQAPERRPLTP